MFKYSVQLDKSRDVYVASIPYRDSVVREGSTEAEAVGAMMQAVAELSYTGALDPDDPYRQGCRPLQHVMNILTDHMTCHLDKRQAAVETSNDDSSLNLSYVNEVIAALATAIAALARVKAL